MARLAPTRLALAALPQLLPLLPLLLDALPPPSPPVRSPLTFPVTVYEYPYTSIADNFQPSVRRRSCMLAPDRGPCRAKVPMFSFNYDSMACEPFSWGGCQGNGNRFDSEQQCLDACLSTNTTKPTVPSFCSLSFDYGFCFGDLPRWHYDRVQQVCKRRVFSGCGGNRNNFPSKQMCENACMYLRTYPTPKTTVPPSFPLGSDGD